MFYLKSHYFIRMPLLIIPFVYLAVSSLFLFFSNDMHAHSLVVVLFQTPITLVLTSLYLHYCQNNVILYRLGLRKLAMFITMFTLEISFFYSLLTSVPVMLTRHNEYGVDFFTLFVLTSLINVTVNLLNLIFIAFFKMPVLSIILVLLLLIADYVTELLMQYPQPRQFHLIYYLFGEVQGDVAIPRLIVYFLFMVTLFHLVLAFTYDEDKLSNEEE